MEAKNQWFESKAKERQSLNFVKTLFEMSGYKVMSFGIENHNREIIREITGNYVPETNRKLLSMPDYVVVDPETKESRLIEVKHRNYNNYFDMKRSNVIFGNGSIKDYLDFWSNATLVLTFNVSPYCLCVDFEDINWNLHFKRRFRRGNGKMLEYWNFYGVYQDVTERFPKVTAETFEKTLRVLGIGK